MKKEKDLICDYYLTTDKLFFNEIIKEESMEDDLYFVEKEIDGVKYRFLKNDNFKFLLDFYLEKEKFDLKHNYLNSLFRIKYVGSMAYVYISSYDIETEQVKVRLKVCLKK